MKVKVIITPSEEILETRLNLFFEENPEIEIYKILQSSSSDFHSYQTTLTIFYKNKV